MDKCKCGKELPTVKDDETPYEFCSEECKTAARIAKLEEQVARLLEAVPSAGIKTT